MQPEQSNPGDTLKVDADGTVHVPAFSLPLSLALSDRARATMAAALSRTPRINIPRAEDFGSDAAFPAIATHRALVQANVDASLHLFDGLGHCFYYDASAPESVDAYQTIIRFFRKNCASVRVGTDLDKERAPPATGIRPLFT